MIRRRAADALRARIGDLRSADPDGGFILVYVLGIIAVVTILVGSTLAIAGASIIPTVRSNFGQAADAAARGGLQAFVAYADEHCDDANSSVATCTLPTNFSERPIELADGGAAGYQARYAWVAQPDPDGRYFRVRSTGTVTQGGITSTRTLVADIAGGASMNLFDYGVVTGYESQSSSDVLANWPRRTIALSGAAIAAAGVPIKGGSITWSGASPGSAAGKVAICNATFEENGGRSNNLPPGAPNPYVDWTESGLQGNNYTHFQPCQTSWGTGTKLLAPENPADGPGGYYSGDAMLLSNSYPGGTGPLFDQPVKTGWRYEPGDAGLCGTTPGLDYRSFNLGCAGYPVEVGGSPSPDSTAGPPQWAVGPQIPTSSPTIPPDACVYAGPTRVRLAGDTAVVTSPQTTAAWVSANAADRPAQCYAGAGPQGMALAQVSLTTPTAIHVIVADNNGKVPPTTPAQAHGSSGWPRTGQQLGDSATTSNSVFYVSAPPPPTTPDPTSFTAADGQPASAPGPMSHGCAAGGSAYSATAGAGCAWTNVHTDTDGNQEGAAGWTANSATGACGSLPAADQRTFACEFAGGTPPDGADEYATLRWQVQHALATSSCAADATGCLSTLINQLVGVANTSGTPTPGAHRYLVTSIKTGSGKADGTNTLSSNAPPAAGDPFFDSSAPGSETVETRTATPITFTVGRQVYACFDGSGAYDPGGSACTGTNPTGHEDWGTGAGRGKSVAQFSGTVTQASWAITSAGQAGVSSFPAMDDVTQYQMGTNGTFGASGPGDLYVEGTATATLALLARNDVIITGSLSTSEITKHTLEIVSQNDTRIYHPVACVDTDATAIGKTSAGFCPNDITGLYSALPPDGSLPYLQYKNLRPDLKDLSVHGAVLALGNAPASFTCPEPPGGGGTCGGEITVDNYDRGTELGQLTLVGTIAMAHHAPVGQEWEIADAAGQSGRPYSGYQLAQQYQNLGSMIHSVDEVSGILQTVSSTSSLWHIVSISTAATPGDGP